MNRKYYNCFSYNQMKFLIFHKVKLEKEMVHSNTGKTFWIFNRNKELDELLNEWSKGKSKFLQPTA